VPAGLVAVEGSTGRFQEVAVCQVSLPQGLFAGFGLEPFVGRPSVVALGVARWI
jgi:hypothetical protein